jgi:hypothetical protein
MKPRFTEAAFHQQNQVEEFDRWVKAKPMLSA